MSLLADSSYPLLNVFWSIFIFFLWVIWIWILIMVFIDIFRSHDLSGWAKALWFLFVLFIPLIGVLVYLIARGGSMHERAAQQARRQDEETRATSSKPRRAHRPARRTSWRSWRTFATGELSPLRSSSARRPRFCPPPDPGSAPLAVCGRPGGPRVSRG